MPTSDPHAIQRDIARSLALHLRDLRERSGLTQEQADYLAEIWMGRNGALASLRRARNAGNAGNSGSSLADTLSESLLIKAERGADAAVEYIAAQLASGAIRSDEAEEIWKLLRASGESDI